MAIKYRVSSILRDNALLWAMLIGALLYEWLSPLAFLSPYLIFLMLFFTFCKVNPAHLRLRSWHLLLLAFQLVVSILIFVALRPFDIILAQGVMLCVFMPTATAAAVITGKLGGSISELTTYTLLTNLLTAILAPALFPLINPEATVGFWEGTFYILHSTFYILILPFLLAWALRVIYKKSTHKEFTLGKTLSAMPFYVWVFALTILIAKTVHSLVNDPYEPLAVIGMAIGSLLTCILQFYVGKSIGSYYDKKMNAHSSSLTPHPSLRISAGQALGQKNTMLAIWLAQAYLIPISSFAPAAYVIFQNLFNAWQLRQRLHNK